MVDWRVVVVQGGCSASCKDGGELSGKGKCPEEYVQKSKEYMSSGNFRIPTALISVGYKDKYACYCSSFEASAPLIAGYCVQMRQRKTCINTTT